MDWGMLIAPDPPASQMILFQQLWKFWLSKISVASSRSDFFKAGRLGVERLFGICYTNGSRKRFNVLCCLTKANSVRENRKWLS